jgi:hypothetical protein
MHKLVKYKREKKKKYLKFLHSTPLNQFTHRPTTEAFVHMFVYELSYSMHKLGKFKREKKKKYLKFLHSTPLNLFTHRPTTEAFVHMFVYELSYSLHKLGKYKREKKKILNIFTIDSAQSIHPPSHYR